MDSALMVTNGIDVKINSFISCLKSIKSSLLIKANIVEKWYDMPLK